MANSKLRKLGTGCFLLFGLASGAFAATYQVEIQNDYFSPKNLTIAPGDTVVWSNIGGSAHTVTADDGSFDSTEMNGGQTFTKTFTDIGRNPYYCLLHGGPGGQEMSGVVRVVDPSVNTAPTTPVNVQPAAGATSVSVSPTLSSGPFTDADDGDVHDASQWIISNVTKSELALDTGASATNKTSLKLADLDFSTTYRWKVRYKDDRGAWSEYSTETEFTTVAAPTSSGAGLTASYGLYNPKKDLFTEKSTQIDPTVSFDWKLGRPFAGIPANNFAVHWKGSVVPEFSELYRFRVKADGGIRLKVKNVLLVDDWVGTPFPVYRSGVINLEAGVPVSIELDYFDGVGPSSVSLSWASHSLPSQIIPKDNLIPLN